MTDSFWAVLGIVGGAVIVGAIINRMGGRHSVRFWVVLLTAIGLASFIDSAVARREDHYSEATYGLIIAILCAYLVRRELDNMRKQVERPVHKGTLIRDYRVGGVRVEALQDRRGRITITGTDEGGNRVSCELPNGSDVDKWCNKVTDIMFKMRSVK